MMIKSQVDMSTSSGSSSPLLMKWIFMAYDILSCTAALALRLPLHPVTGLPIPCHTITACRVRHGTYSRCKTPKVVSTARLPCGCIAAGITSAAWVAVKSDECTWKPFGDASIMVCPSLLEVATTPANITDLFAQSKLSSGIILKMDEVYQGIISSGKTTVIHLERSSEDDAEMLAKDGFDRSVYLNSGVIMIRQPLRYKRNKVSDSSLVRDDRSMAVFGKSETMVLVPAVPCRRNFNVDGGPRSGWGRVILKAYNLKTGQAIEMAEETRKQVHNKRVKRVDAIATGEEPSVPVLHVGDDPLVRDMNKSGAMLHTALGRIKELHLRINKATIQFNQDLHQMQSELQDLLTRVNTIVEEAYSKAQSAELIDRELAAAYDEVVSCGSTATTEIVDGVHHTAPPCDVARPLASVRLETSECSAHGADNKCGDDDPDHVHDQVDGEEEDSRTQILVPDSLPDPQRRQDEDDVLCGQDTTFPSLDFE